MELSDAEIAWLRRWDLAAPEIDLAEVRVHVGGPIGVYLKATRHGAITFGRRIWFRDGKRREDADLLVHELAHVGQYRQRGSLGFLTRYLLDLLKHRGYSRELPLEVPAYEAQGRARQVARRSGGPRLP